MIFICECGYFSLNIFVHKINFLLKLQKSKENHQNLADLNDQSCPLLDKKEESLLPELLEVKPAEFECKKLQIKKQWEYLFVPSSSPGIMQLK